MFTVKRDECTRMRVRGVHIPLVKAITWVHETYKINLGDLVNEALADWLSNNADEFYIPDGLLYAAHILPANSDDLSTENSDHA